MAITGIFTALVIGVPLFGGGLALLLWARSRDRAADVAGSWDQVSGRITAAEVEPYRSMTSTGGATTTTTTTYTTMYRPRVTYEYSAGGRTIAGDRLSLSGEVGRSTPASAEEQLAQYTVGSSVTVYVDPADPTSACLQPVARGGRMLRIIGIVLMVSGILAAVGTIAFVVVLDAFLDSAT